MSDLDKITQAFTPKKENKKRSNGGNIPYGYFKDQHNVLREQIGSLVSIVAQQQEQIDNLEKLVLKLYDHK